MIDSESATSTKSETFGYKSPIKSIGSMLDSEKIVSEGEKSTPDKLTKYEWGRLRKKPEYWEYRRFLVWGCPACDYADVRGTKQKTANRYHPLQAKCEDCGKITRDITKEVILWFDKKNDALGMAIALDDARRKR